MSGSDTIVEGRSKTAKAPAKRETSAIDRFVGERIRLYRAMLGISQQKLAESLGITFQQLQKYERGQNRIGAGRLLMVATILEIPITFLLDEESFSQLEEGIKPSAEYSSQMSREGYSIGRAFSQITDPDIRRSISSLVRSLAENGNEP